MIAGVFLLLAVEVFRDCSASTPCVPSNEVTSFTPADLLNVSGHVKIYAGQSFDILLRDGDMCQWSRKGEMPILNGSHSLTTQLLSEVDSGKYTLCCQSQNGTSTSMSVHLHVETSEPPSKPKLILSNIKKKASPWFKCTTNGIPTPSIKWSSERDAEARCFNDSSAENQISSLSFEKGIMCCASNIAGQECSQLLDIDLTNNVLLSDVTLSPGQSLLMRCTARGSYPEIQKDNTNVTNLPICPSKDTSKACLLKDSHYPRKMWYLSIPSLTVNDSGTYTCKNETHTKSLNVSVQAEGSLSVEMESLAILRENISSSCLQANVSYHPSIQKCFWETPDQKANCLTDDWLIKQRRVRLCKRLQTGEYKLHIEAGGRKETKSISLCVVDKPDLKISAEGETYTVKFSTHVPANYSWMSCSNNCYEVESSWEVINKTIKIDSVSCKKDIQSSLRRFPAGLLFLRVCLANSVSQWCGPPYTVLQSQPVFDNQKEENGTLLKTSTILLLLALTIVSILLLYFIKKKKPKYEPQLQMIQMIGPNDNDYIYINFKDFAYDSQWEFPRENLELGKELGSGAFGMVVQATAYGIDKPGVSQQVAVKMLKEKHQRMEKEALMSELKMLTHIGHHANIVNLLGACTESGPIFLIFQYCRYGDLLNYLKNNSERYHKSVTDAFNKDRFSSLYHNLNNSKPVREITATVDNYVPMHSSTTRGQENIALLTLNSTGETENFEDLHIYESSGEEDDQQALTFDDLLSFAYQVARGMEFLASKNCIHRDLAARNVLVTKGRMAKIGDFGLARDIDTDSNYVVRGNVRLPVKWMAPESIFQGMYTMKSDVWAYGILLWEIFSLGVSPYPGVKVDHTFYAMIERGFKMESPYYATESVYNIMCKCWELDSSNRPSFSKLVSFMAVQMTDREEKLYHNTLDTNSNDYQNTSSVLEITALMKQTENNCVSGNDYSPAYTTEKSERKLCKLDTEDDGKLMKA